MFSKYHIKGRWPTSERFVFASCDNTYFDQFAERFEKSFKQHFDLPVHLHLINPQTEQMMLCSQWGVTYTYNHIDDGLYKERVDAVKKSKPDISDEVANREVYWGFCQAIRFWMLGQYQTEKQNIVVADIDCVAVQKPTNLQWQDLFAKTQFSKHYDRVMATFCMFTGDNLQQTKEFADWIENYDKETGIRNGVDQLAMAKIFTKPNRLPNGWISHEDTKDEQSIKRKIKANIVFHSKGTRGKSIDLSKYL